MPWEQRTIEYVQDRLAMVEMHVSQRQGSCMSAEALIAIGNMNKQAKKKKQDKRKERFK